MDKYRNQIKNREEGQKAYLADHPRKDHAMLQAVMNNMQKQKYLQTLIESSRQKVTTPLWSGDEVYPLEKINKSTQRHYAYRFNKIIKSKTYSH